MQTIVAALRAVLAVHLLGLIIVCAACSSGRPDTAAAASGVGVPAATQPGDMKSGSEWPSYNGGYNATRFSSLSQINTSNVASLSEVARFKLPETTAFQSGPAADRRHHVRHNGDQYLRLRSANR